MTSLVDVTVHHQGSQPYSDILAGLRKPKWIIHQAMQSYSDKLK